MEAIVAKEHPSGGKSDPLSRDALLDAALAIARAEGLGAVTMRRLATETGKAPMTLYSHIPNKQSLLILVADAVLSDIPISEAAWDDALRDLCMSTWRRLREVPGLAAFVWHQVPYLMTPQGLRLADGAVGLLIRGGFYPVAAGQGLESLMTYVTGDVERHQARLDAVRISTRQLKGYPNLQAIASQNRSGKTDSALEETFSYGLELLLEGLRRDPRRTRANVRSRATKPKPP